MNVKQLIDYTVSSSCFTFHRHVCTISCLGLVMVPSWPCRQQTATAPSCPSLLGNWALRSRSLLSWKSLSQTAALRKKGRSHQRAKTPLRFPSRQAPPQTRHPKPAAVKKTPRVPPQQMKRRPPRNPDRRLSRAGSPLTRWRAGGSPLLPNLRLPQQVRLRHLEARALPRLPSPPSLPSHRPAPPGTSPATHLSLPPHQRFSTLLGPQPLKVRPPQKDPPQGKHRRRNET